MAVGALPERCADCMAQADSNLPGLPPSRTAAVRPGLIRSVLVSAVSHSPRLIGGLEFALIPLRRHRGDRTGAVHRLRTGRSSPRTLVQWSSAQSANLSHGAVFPDSVGSRAMAIGTHEPPARDTPRRVRRMNALLTRPNRRCGPARSGWLAQALHQSSRRWASKQTQARPRRWPMSKPASGSAEKSRSGTGGQRCQSLSSDSNTPPSGFRRTKCSSARNQSAGATLDGRL
jgi:hypothetical protein